MANDNTLAAKKSNEELFKKHEQRINERIDKEVKSILEKENLNTALLEFQKLNVSATKDSKNPHFKSNYASLEAVIQATSQANQFGICFTQDIDFDAESSMVFVRTTLIHAPSGETRTSRTPIRSKDPADPQKMGSGITYAKRYGLQSMLGLPSEDDDGNEASKSTNKPIEITQEPNSF